MKISKQIVLIPLFALTLSDTLVYVSYSGNASGTLVNTAVAFFRYLSFFSVIYICNKTERNKDIPSNLSILMSAIMIWQIITLIKGVLLVNDYWDWKFLLFESFLFLSVPLTYYVGKIMLFFKTICIYTLKYLFKFGFLIIPLALVTNTELYSRLMMPVSVIILLVPFFERKWRILIFIVAVVSVAIEPDLRTNIIKTATSLCILATYYYRQRISVGLIKITHLVLFALPLFLAFLAFATGYNVFADVLQEDDKYEFRGANGETANLASDTRTFLYQEVITSLVNNGTLITGEGASGKYRSDFFNEHGTGRYSSEVGILNIILYSGLIGAVLYLSFLLLVSYYGIYRSNNWLSKMFGLLISVRWTLLFIEEFTQFDLNFYFFWLALGLLSSQKFRQLSDAEVIELFSFSS